MTVPVLGEVLVNQNKAIEALLAEQRKRDLEEFREMVENLKAKFTYQKKVYHGSALHEGGESALGQILGKIDAKLSEIKT